MTTAMRPSGWRSLPALPDLIARMIPIPWLRARLESDQLPIEEYVEDGQYVVRVELPGVDPTRDTEITVADGALIIKAERPGPANGERRSEFRYGRFERAVPLPRRAKEDAVSATYTNGILSVTLDLAEPDDGHRVPIDVPADAPDDAPE